MDARILELIKTPEVMTLRDLDLLKKEIKEQPYVQSVRALYLFGTHRFRSENYPQELTKTAAYTTDKKILYHFINQNQTVQIDAETIGDSIENQQIEVNQVEEENVSPEPLQEMMPIENGLVFTSENESIAEILPENQLETEPISEPENVEIINESSDKNEVSDSEQSSLEIVDNEELNSENDTAINFGGAEDFMPNIAVEAVKPKETFVPQPTANRHEEEMKRLLAEVEAKIKAKKEKEKEKTTEAKSIISEEKSENTDEISFAETEDFFTKEKEEISAIEEKESENIEVQKEFRNWKPMSFEPQKPDAIINKEDIETSDVSEKLSTEKLSESVKNTQRIEENRPIFNVSFFAETVEKIEAKTELEMQEYSEEVALQKVENHETSNVSEFIATWENWLKSDSIEIIKEEAIEKFIENEPKITKNKKIKERNDEVSDSELSENEGLNSKNNEIDFITRDRNYDISHLMTETLAKLYIDQKLYAKAIQAYEILQEKHPEKTDYFAEQIEIIKKLKSPKF